MTTLDHDPIHTCSHCQRIIIRPLFRESRNLTVTRLPHTPREALRAAQDGCPLFRHVLRGYLRAFSKDSVLTYTKKLAREIAHFPEELNLIVSRLAVDQSKTPFRLRCLEDRDWSSVRHCAAFETLNWESVRVSDMFAKPCDPAARENQVRLVKPWMTPRDSLRKANDWLKSCRQNRESSHKKCFEPHSPAFIPTRLLHISPDDNQVRLKLCHPRPGQDLEYACLSYCWGGTQPVKTTLESVHSFFSGIPLASLPRTIQDAIEVANCLGIRYIWIDCLCIVQDDPRDMMHELTQMPLIYEHAFITISAASAGSCLEGFLQERPNPYEFEAQLSYACLNGRIGKVTYSQERVPPTGSEDPVDSRAWVFQEKLMPKRLLEFGTNELRLRCRSATAFHPLRAKRQDRHLVHIADEPLKRLISNADEAADVHPETVIRAWHRAMVNYTRRRLTYPGDKFIACAAVAQRLGESYNLTYRAGLWKEHMASELLWSVGLPIADGIARPLEYRAPSWSWASVNGSISHGPLDSYLGEEDQDIEIISCEVSLTDPNFLYGAVTAGSLVVRGRLREIRWRHNDHNLLEPVWIHDGGAWAEDVTAEGAFCTSLWHDDLGGKADMEALDAWAHDFLFPVLLGYYSTTWRSVGLVLRRLDGGKRYMRVGYYERHAGPDIFEGVEKKLIEIV